MAEMQRRVHDGRGARRGGVLVEFALTTPFAVVLLFAMIEFGNVVFAYSAVYNLARQGARYAIVRGSGCTKTGCPATSSSIQTWVQGQAAGLNSSNITVTTTWSSNGTCSTSPYQSAGCLVTVTVSYPYSLLMHPIVHASWTMSSTSKMIMAQ